MAATLVGVMVYIPDVVRFWHYTDSISDLKPRPKDAGKQTS